MKRHELILLAVLSLATLLWSAVPAKGALAEVSYTATGTATYTVPFSYLDASHVYITVDDVTSTYTWDDSTTIRPDSTPTSGQVVRIYRSTPVATATVVFSRGVRLTANRMNKAFNQALFNAQELFDSNTQLDTRLTAEETNTTSDGTRLTAEEATSTLLSTNMSDVLVRLTALEAVIDAAATTPGNETVPINDITAPAVPSGLVVESSGDGFVSLQWGGNIEPDFSSYAVGRDVSGGTSYTTINLNPVTGTAFVDSTVVNDTAYDYVVLAIDDSGNPSAWTSPITTTPAVPVDVGGSVDMKFDFQGTGGTLAPGYTEITSTTAYSGGVGYGWSVMPDSDRNRTPVTADDVETDFVLSNSGEPATFAVALSNGTYDITITIGDEGGGINAQDITIEDTLVLTKSVLAGAFYTETFTATITDGQLNVTILSAGGWSRINGITVVDNATGTPAPPYSGGGDNAPDTAPDAAGSSGFAGINLQEIAYWSRQLPFKNVMQTSRERWDITGGTATYDANHWPILSAGATAQTLTCKAMAGNYPSGDYTVTWDGDGTVRVWGDNGDDASPTSPMIITVTPANGGLWVEISNSDPSDHVRNLKIVMPSPDNDLSTGSFNSWFLGALNPYSTIRFMDWQRTNHSSVVNWSDLHGPTHATQEGRSGVAIEYMVELANAMESDVWFCMPHGATDDFITQFATYVRNNIHPGAAVYIEHSNELWNGGFNQVEWVENIGGGDIFSPAYFDQWADGCDRTFTIWHDIWDDADKGDGTDARARVVRVVAGQLANVWVTEQVAMRVTTGIDAIAPAAYMGHDRSEYTSATTKSQMFSQLSTHIINVVTPQLAKHKILADLYSARLIAYEGGQHLVANNDKIIEWGLQAEIRDMQDDALMGTRYNELMDAAYGEGIDLLMFFNDVDLPDDWGTWGQLDAQDGWTPANITGPGSIKYKAIVDWVEPP